MQKNNFGIEQFKEGWHAIKPTKLYCYGLVILHIASQNLSINRKTTKYVEIDLLYSLLGGFMHSIENLVSLSVVNIIIY